MRLKLKNKFQLSIRKAVEAAESNGGIIKHVEMTADEALEFIDEMHDCREQEELVKKVTIERNDRKSVDFRMIMFRNTQLKPEIKKKLVAGWQKNAYNILYDDIPLIVTKEQEPTPAKASEEGWMKDSQPTK